ncbi:hypothetical protein ACLB2K_005895 [Fragaria x ananassa]
MRLIDFGAYKSVEVLKDLYGNGILLSALHTQPEGHKPPIDWTVEDDTEILCAVEKYGEKQWYMVRELLSRRRKVGDCKTRWEEYVRPILLQVLPKWRTGRGREKKKKKKDEEKRRKERKKRRKREKGKRKREKETEKMDEKKKKVEDKKLKPTEATVASNFSFVKTPLRCQQRYEALRTAPVDKPKASTDPKVAETWTHGPQKPITPKTGHNHKERLVAWLKKISRKELPVAGDRNCLYRALSHQLYGDEKHYRYVKELVIAQLRSCPVLYTCFFDGDYGKLVSQAAKDGTWALLLAVRAASDLFQRNIVMVGNEQERESYVFTPQRKAVAWETLWITYYKNRCNSTVKDDME